ncbi:hypothetical protein JGS22_023380 [Streptomyces sp. P38-E01]|uniref:Insertion element protein n=1 Tax=Streptomyces tardus TaxID=2780544 RepID=A0A949JI06_9ACTN|nr:hypothetical protein [Streptomyces tardus]MBU7600488.1 hypothetical protein [Streptomyces tardus]
MSERAAPYYCPYCGEEDLRPSEEGPGAWECADCNRAFAVKFLGLLAAGFRGGASAPADTSPTHDRSEEEHR